MASLITPLNIGVPIVDKETGNPTPYFQQLLQKLSSSSSLTSTNGVLGLADKAVTYAKIQDITATKRVLGRNTALAGVTEEVTLSQLLDWVGTAARGDVLYRGASTWSRLPAGTAGQVLTTQGTGADPTWTTPSGGGGGGFETTGTVPVIANFTLMNPVAGLTMVDSTFGIVVNNTAASGQLHFAKSNTTIASTTFSIVTRMRGINPISGGNYQGAIFLRNNTSGRLLVFGNDNSEGRVFASQWSAYATFNVNLFSTAMNPTAYPWKRLLCTAGSISFDISTDGVTWYNMGVTTLAAYINAGGGSTDQVGVGLYANAGTICNSYVQT